MDDSHNLKQGKWSKLGVPHKGWRCVGTRDQKLEGLEMQTCEMCESQDIRYVHRMAHDSYPAVLECGCDCAAHMEENRTAAEDRDKIMRNRASRRKAFPDRRGWKRSRNGNLYITAGSVRCVIFKKGNGYSIVASYKSDTNTTWGERLYETEREAKGACFHAVEYLQNKFSKHQIAVFDHLMAEEHRGAFAMASSSNRKRSNKFHDLRF